jgi:phage/plasmid-like protein (TIGR03299 family)
MAHNLYSNNGRIAMWCTGDRKAAWHELGQRTPDAQTWDQAMTLSGLDWRVIKRQLFGSVAEVSASDRVTLDHLVPVPAYGIFRDSDGAYLGTVGDQYTPIQNQHAFEFVDTLLEAGDGAHYESAGALGNGERIWCLAKVPHTITVAGEDKSEVYLLFTTSHDGSMAATCKMSTIRVVCQNTLNQALSANGAMVRVKHTRDAAIRLDQARKLMEGVGVDAKKLEEKLNLLAARKMTKDSMLTIFDRLFPAPKDKDSNTTRRENVLADVLRLYESNDKNVYPQIRGTAYNLLNAITEYTDHERTARITSGRSGYTLAQARAENAFVGTGDALKQEALDVIFEDTAGNPVHSQVYSRPILDRPTAPSTGSLLDAVLDNHNN